MSYEICNKGFVCKRCNKLISSKYSKEHKTYLLKGVRMSGFFDNDFYLCLDCCEELVNFLNNGE